MGPPEIIQIPEIPSQKVADFECRFPYGPYGKNRARFWPFLGEGFWGNIRWPLLLPAFFVLLLIQGIAIEIALAFQVSLPIAF